jgi:hypothetical protein
MYSPTQPGVCFQSFARDLTEFSIGTMLFAVQRRSSSISRSVQLWILAGALTVADMAVFVHCVPIICQAWGSNRWFMGSLFAGIFVWAESLANLWGAGIRELQLSRMGQQASVPLLPLCATKGAIPMFDSLDDLSTKLAATGYFIDPVMTQVVYLIQPGRKRRIESRTASGLSGNCASTKEAGVEETLRSDSAAYVCFARTCSLERSCFSRKRRYRSRRDAGPRALRRRGFLEAFLVDDSSASSEARMEPSDRGS